MINYISLSILPALLFFAASTISPRCLAFSIPTHVHSTSSWQRLTMMTGQGRHTGSTYTPFHFMVPDNNDKDNDNTDQTFPLPTMNLSGDVVRTPDGKTVTNKDIEDELDQILAFKDMFEQSRIALNEEDEVELEARPTQKLFSTEKMLSTEKLFSAEKKQFSWPGKPSPAPTYVPEKPSKQLTGVEPYVTSICATISLQIYNATNITSFDLINKNDKNSAANVTIFENHGILNDLVPPFAVAVSGDTMILAWRGSQTIMDWASDFSASPVTSCRWSQVSEFVKAHSGYASLVESDMTMYENKLIEEIDRLNITQLVTTGHSLAGGMAQVCHVFLEGQLQQQGSPWNKLLGRLTVRSIAFAAPMTIMSTVDFDAADKQTKSFLQNISYHSCNIVYGPDVVPHAAGDTKYVIDAIEAVIPDVTKQVTPGWAAWFAPIFGIPKRLEHKLEAAGQKEGVIKLLKVVKQYNHIGKIIYYADNSPNPVELRDNQIQSLPANLPFFRENKLIQVPKSNVELQLKQAHGRFPRALAYNVPEDKQGSK